ncbi:tRNA (guanosine(46)-N7)-methyltransferase TrmB [Fictibacillus phosphorivorans]|uniref:tRNA (guanosine(46)-N7)-methyltransferase TrmB n=1 Tax=Fictibacillus phosphorivorans TaxID=1221500 RepID=UPI00203E8DD3|nr:tRNA (guanosine(46)-N7)-methyltransferase TrmB [Fictibacillus phosphorivorans]MCM3717989.1 tRNA (guanosine(46)-N7)-methyltransferase TrmB [Fictibacillus phosphorivorans]MCM3775438.1 tRNA (guanosine(46)-N7)-methyltransferase TrmB [Fictibacillus phosphorivorans]
MRQRFKPWAKEKLMENTEIVSLHPESMKGKWSSFFGNDNPIHIEVGTGKGQFINGMGKQNPSINYLGMELYDSIIVSALDRILEDGSSNVKLIRADATHLLDYFEEGEIDRVYLNFSDPWPKKKHAKRRLTHESFLERYETILKKQGEIHFKTDNQGLFEYSLHSMSKYGMIFQDVSLDLHNSGMEDNIMTEYEEKFSEKGFRIYRMEAQFRS